MLAVKAGVCKGDDRNESLLLAKCRGWSSQTSRIWKETSLKFQVNRERQRRFTGCVGRHRKSNCRARAWRGSREWESLLIPMGMRQPWLHWPGQGEEETGYKRKNAIFSGQREISTSLCLGRRVARNLPNPLSFPRLRECGEEGIWKSARAGEQSLGRESCASAEILAGGVRESESAYLIFSMGGSKVGNKYIILPAEESWPHQISQQ